MALQAVPLPRRVGSVANTGLASARIDLGGPGWPFASTTGQKRLDSELGASRSETGVPGRPGASALVLGAQDRPFPAGGREQFQRLGPDAAATAGREEWPSRVAAPVPSVVTWGVVSATSPSRPRSSRVRQAGRRRLQDSQPHAVTLARRRVCVSSATPSTLPLHRCR